MYKIEWDEENNFAVLKNEGAVITSEVRPVFSAELKNLGFEKYVTFEESESAPLLFADHYQYYYRGHLVAQLLDSGCLKAPSIQILDERFVGQHLAPIDLSLWFQKNRSLMDQLVQDTLLRIYRVYMEWKDRVDYISVAYSGGKDSMALLYLIKRVLPKGSYFVSWIDSGMEHRQSRETVENEARRCEKEGIPFIKNRSLFDPLDAWETIGPPSFENRWCCSVLQSVPSIIQLKEHLGKKDAKGLVFLGNRAAESSQRTKSSLVKVGAKHNSQVDANGIISWNSLEVFLFLMMNGIQMNPGYIKGFLRIGCLLCPRASTLSLSLVHQVSPEETRPYYDIIRSTYRGGFESEEALEDYINLGDWRFRKDAKGTRYHLNYREDLQDGQLRIEMKSPKTDWKTWIKTIGMLVSCEKDPEKENRIRCLLRRGAEEIPFTVDTDGETLNVSIRADAGQAFLPLFKTVFRKAAACIGCRTCEANCPNDHLRFADGTLEIDDGCLHCAQCHNDKHLCVVFDSWYLADQVL